MAEQEKPAEIKIPKSQAEELKKEMEKSTDGCGCGCLLGCQVKVDP
jgi:hypothetical protein